MPLHDDPTPLSVNLARELQETQQQIKELMVAISQLDKRVFSGDKESLTMRQEFAERDILALRNTIEQLKAGLEFQAAQGRQVRQDIFKIILGMVGTVITGTLIWAIQTQWAPKPTPQPSPSPEETPLLPEGSAPDNGESGP